MTANIDRIDNQLFRLQMVCNRYKEVDPLADWVLFAISRHISTGRSVRDFDRWFTSLSEDRLLDMIRYCLNRSDRSNDGIMKSIQIFREGRIRK